MATVVVESPDIVIVFDRDPSAVVLDSSPIVIAPDAAPVVPVQPTDPIAILTVPTPVVLVDPNEAVILVDAPVSDGGGGGGFESPLTDLGDILTHDGQQDVRLPAPTDIFGGPVDGFVLTSSPFTALGVEWRDPGAGGGPGPGPGLPPGDRPGQVLVTQTEYNEGYEAYDEYGNPYFVEPSYSFSFQLSDPITTPSGWVVTDSGTLVTAGAEPTNYYYYYYEYEYEYEYPEDPEDPEDPGGGGGGPILPVRGIYVDMPLHASAEELNRQLGWRTRDDI